MIRLYYRFSIKNKIFLFIIATILMSAIITMAISITVANRFIKEQYTDSYLNEAFTEINSNFGMMFENINILPRNINANTDFYRCLLNTKLSYEAKKIAVDKFVAEFMDNIDLICAVDIIPASGSVFRYSKSDFDAPKPEKEFLQKLTNEKFVLYDKSVCVNGEYYICLGKRLYNFSTSLYIGDIVMYIDETNFRNVYENNLFEHDVFFITLNGKILSHPQNRFINSEMYFITEMFENNDGDTSESDKKYYYKEFDVAQNYIHNFPKMVCLLHFNDLYNAIRRMELLLIIVAAVVIIISIIVAFSLSKRLTNEITKFKNDMTFFAENPESEVEIKGYDEIYALESTFNKMILKIRELIVRINNDEKKRRALELNSLQSQINPHFLYNALNVISCMAKQNNQPEIDNVAHSLSSFFRIGLHKGENIIYISEELEHVKSYLQIEKYKSPDFFDITFEIDDGLYQCRILKLLLQPVVENAIKHGFNGGSYHGIIRIKGYFDYNKDIIFEIIDNGFGTEEYCQGEIPASKNEQGGYGLKNVSERIKLEYGNSYGVSFFSGPGMGTRVKIHIKNIDK